MSARGSSPLSSVQITPPLRVITDRRGRECRRSRAFCAKADAVGGQFRARNEELRPTWVETAHPAVIPAHAGGNRQVGQNRCAFSSAWILAFARMTTKGERQAEAQDRTHGLHRRIPSPARASQRRAQPVD